MSIEATSRASAPMPAATPSAAAIAAQAQANATATKPAAAAPQAKAEAPPKIEKTRLYESEKVDLGFRAEEMRKNLEEAVSRLNEQMQRNGRDLSFSMDEKINRPVITVKNIETGEVVRQIPTEEVVRMAHSIEDMKGLLFNETL